MKLFAGGSFPTGKAKAMKGPFRNFSEAFRVFCPTCRRVVNLDMLPEVKSVLQSVGKHVCWPRKCSVCNRLFVQDFLRSPEDGLSYLVCQFPTGHESVAEELPEAVGIDLKEASACLSVGANKAAVSMCRRALEGSMGEKGAAGSTLYEKIEDLKNKGILTEVLAETAHEIRFLGNYGAHPQDDALDQVDRAEADGLFEFVVTLFKYLYELPAQLAKRKSERQKSH